MKQAGGTLIVMRLAEAYQQTGFGSVFSQIRRRVNLYAAAGGAF
jgi:hypothetical protein